MPAYPSAWLGLALCLLLAASAAAQAPGENPGSSFARPLALTLVDSFGRGVGGTVVRSADGAYVGVSDEAGRVVLTKVDTAAAAAPVRQPDTLLVSGTGVGVRAVAWPRSGRVVVPVVPLALTEALVVGRRNDRADDLPWYVATIDAGEIARRQAQTTATALELTGEVFVQRSQMGGGSPVLRGFEANRVLLVVDGVRLNNAIYREGHLQSSITVDPHLLRRAEVIFGPGSLHYGSDAIGGVVHFRTKQPRLRIGDENAIGGAGFLRHATANGEATGHFDLEYRDARWASLTSVTVSRFGDLRAGREVPAVWGTRAQTPYYVARLAGRDSVLANGAPAVQRGTGYAQLDLAQKVMLQLSPKRELDINLQLSNSTDIPRFDNLALYDGENPRNLTYAEWYYGPQTRLFGSLRSVNTRRTRLHDRAQWIASAQRIDEDRFERLRQNPWRDFILVRVNVFGLTYDADKTLDERGRHRVSYGLDGQHNTVSSDGGRSNVETGEERLDRLSRYPSGGSTMSSAAAYATYRFAAPGADLDGQAGLRYSRTYLNAAFGREGVTEPITWPESLRDGISGENAAWTGAAGLTWHPAAGTQVQGLVSTAFRAPNVDDFGKTRVRGAFVLVPNPELGPERAVSAELTLGQTLGEPGGSGFAARLSATAFATQLGDVVVRANGQLPSGDTTFVSSGRTYRVQTNVNADRGRVRGVGLRADLTYGPAWSLGLRATYTHGRAIAQDGERTPLAHIPPVFGQALARYRHGRLDVTAVGRFNGRKAWRDYAPLGSSDNAELAIAGYGTPAWFAVDVMAGYRLLGDAAAPRLELQVGIENIGDLYYKPFSSGVGAPGRNVVVGLRGAL